VDAKERNLFRKSLILKFVDPKTRNWPRDMKIAAKLLAEFPDSEFWEGYNPTRQFPSLASFLTPFGHSLLVKQWRIYKLELKPQKTHNLAEEKLGEDKEIKAKPRSIFEFLGV